VLARKDTPTVLAAFKSIIGVMKPCKRLSSDPGSEFISAPFKAYCAERGMQQDITAAGDHFRLGMIDKFTQTFRSLVERYVTATGDHRWDRVIPLIFRNYNTTKHRSINATPQEVWRDPGKSKETHEYEPVRPDLRVGALVRVAEKKGRFAKSAAPSWSAGTHRVTERISLARWKVEGFDTPRHYSELRVVGASEGVRKTRHRQAR
jgi:hypothetical protein